MFNLENSKRFNLMKIDGENWVVSYEDLMNPVSDHFQGRTVEYVGIVSISFDLSVDEFYNLTQQNCFYCDIEPKQIKSAWSKKSKPFIYNGVDRIDSNKGYSIDNSVPCCSRCNYAKGDMNVEDYKLWVQRTYKHLFEKNNII